MNQEDQVKIYQMNINSQIKAVFLEKFLISDQEEESQGNIDENKIKQVISENNVQLVITTRVKEELKFINQPIIYVNGKDDHNTIKNYNNQISIEGGNILYLFDKYITMIKYIISFQLTKNLTSDFHNLDSITISLIKKNDLVSYFNDFQNKEISSDLTGTGSGVQGKQIKYNLPSPIKIPVFTMNRIVMN